MKDRYISKPAAYYRDKRNSSSTFARDRSAALTIGSVTPASGFSAITSGAWDMISAIRHVLSEIGPSELWVSTWVPGLQEIMDLKALIDEGSVVRLQLLVDYGFESSRRSHADSTIEIIGPSNILVGRNHSKIVLFRNDRFHYVLRGSCNLNANRRAENLDGDEGVELFNAFLSFFDDHRSIGGTGFGRSGADIYRAHRQIMTSSTDEPEAMSEFDEFLRTL
jgi:hypothetical protein